MPVTKETTELHVAGMSCAGCTKRVVRVLERLEGVRDAEVTLEDESTRVDYDPVAVDVKSLKQAIEKTGYRAEEGRLSVEPTVRIVNAPVLAWPEGRR